jgi:hypothetical protein
LILHPDWSTRLSYGCSQNSYFHDWEFL